MRVRKDLRGNDSLSNGVGNMRADKSGPEDIQDTRDKDCLANGNRLCPDSRSIFPDSRLCSPRYGVASRGGLRYRCRKIAHQRGDAGIQEGEPAAG